MLLYFHQNHERFSEIPRIVDAPDSDYVSPRKWTTPVKGVPFVKLCAVERTLLEQPYLTRDQYNALDDEAQVLLAATKPLREAEPIYPKLIAMEAQLAAEHDEASTQRRNKYRHRKAC